MPLSELDMNEGVRRVEKLKAQKKRLDAMSQNLKRGQSAKFKDMQLDFIAAAGRAQWEIKYLFNPGTARRKFMAAIRNLLEEAILKFCLR